MAAVPFFLPLPPFSVSSRLYGGWITCAWSFRVICFPNLFGAQKCYSNFSSVNRNIVSYCLSLCIDRNVTGYFTPSWSVHKVIRKSANYTRDRTGHIETVPHVLSFCAVFWWICIGMLTNFICRIASWVFYLFLLCFSHCEACVISFLLLAHRGRIWWFSVCIWSLDCRALSLSAHHLNAKTSCPSTTCLFRSPIFCNDRQTV
jgi:hypothetical protein